MGRSVSYLSRAEEVTYLSLEFEDDDMYYDDFRENLFTMFSDKYPTLSDVTHKWDGNETSIIMENRFCEIGLSEYCGLWSISIRVNDSYDRPGIARHWINQVWPKMLDMLTKCYGEHHLARMGGMSDGTSVYTSRKVA